MDDENLRNLVRNGREAERLEVDGPDPFDCPPYADALEGSELEELIAHLRTLAPKKRTWRFK